MGTTDSTISRDTITSILETCRSMRLLSNIGFEPPISNPPIRQPLSLPYPSDITQELERVGVSPLVISELTGAYRSACLEIRQNAISSAHQCRIKSDGSFRLFEKTYLKNVERVKHCVLKQAIRTLKSDAKPLNVFKKEYTPLLEQYFERNQYPSQRHQEILAQRSQMSLRQIVVWFQNHRRVARKEGKELKRRSDFSDLDLEKLWGENPGLASPRRCKRISPSPSRSTCSVDNQIATTDRERHVQSVLQWISKTPCESFTFSRPKHAFPAPFPNSGVTLTPEIPGFDWARKSIHPTPSRRKHPDIESFERDFRRLNVFYQPDHQRLKRKRSRDEASDSQTGTDSDSVNGDESCPRKKKRSLYASRRLSYTSISSSSSRALSVSSESSFTSSAGSELFTTPNAPENPSVSPCSPHSFFQQRLSWHSSKFTEWASLPVLTMNFIPLNLPFSPRAPNLGQESSHLRLTLLPHS